MLTLPILAILVGILGCLYLGVIVLYGNHPRIASWKFQVVASIVLLGIPVIWAISYKPKLSASTVKSSQDTKISEQYSPTTDTATQNTNQENHGTVDSAQAIPIHHGTSDQTQAQVTRKPKAPDTQQTPAIGNVVQGAGSAFSVNQSGGVTAGTYNNFVPPQRTGTRGNPPRPPTANQLTNPSIGR